MKKIYTAYHEFEYEDGIDDCRTIGHFTKLKFAKAAIDAVRHKPGFVDFPKGFSVSRTTPNTIGWTEGFITWAESFAAMEEQEIGENDKDVLR